MNNISVSTNSFVCLSFVSALMSHTTVLTIDIPMMDLQGYPLTITIGQHSTPRLCLGECTTKLNQTPVVVNVCTLPLPVNLIIEHGQTIIIIHLIYAMTLMARLRRTSL